jgi:hypothetical protein
LKATRAAATGREKITTATAAATASDNEVINGFTGGRVGDGKRTHASKCMDFEIAAERDSAARCFNKRASGASDTPANQCLKDASH